MTNTPRKKFSMGDEFERLKADVDIDTWENKVHRLACSYSRLLPENALLWHSPTANTSSGFSCYDALLRYLDGLRLIHTPISVIRYLNLPWSRPRSHYCAGSHTTAPGIHTKPHRESHAPENLPEICNVYTVCGPRVSTWT